MIRCRYIGALLLPVVVFISACDGTAGPQEGCNGELREYWRELGTMDYEKLAGPEDTFEDSPAGTWGEDIEPKRFPVSQSLYEAYRHGWIKACEDDPRREAPCVGDVTATAVSQGRATRTPPPQPTVTATQTETPPPEPTAVAVTATPGAAPPERGAKQASYRLLGSIPPYFYHFLMDDRLVNLTVWSMVNSHIRQIVSLVVDGQEVAHLPPPGFSQFVGRQGTTSDYMSGEVQVLLGEDVRISVVYPLFRESDPFCCPTGGRTHELWRVTPVGFQLVLQEKLAE